MKKAASTSANSAAEAVNAYLAALDPIKRASLEKLRAQIKAAAPDAVECISYQMPAFRQGGVLLCYAAWKAHCAIYPGGALTTELADELSGYDFDKGTIRFRPEKPLPAPLVRKIVIARLAAIDARRSMSKSAAKKNPPPRKREN